MPQGKRKIPFSGKRKKQQLQEKRDRKKDVETRSDQYVSTSECKIVEEVTKTDFESSSSLNLRQLEKQRQPDRYRLKFISETKDEVEKRKREGYRILNVVSHEPIEMNIMDVFLPGSELDIPKRPSWDYSQSKAHLDARENAYFTDYLVNIEKRFNLEDLSYFETNLETWRQLWRVLEMSDVLLIIVDIRFASLLFSPVLYDHISKELNRDVILVLNKIDLVPLSVAIAWKHYFERNFPRLNITFFSSYSSKTSENEDFSCIRKKTRPSSLRMAAQATKRLLAICKEIVKNNVDLSTWESKIEEELSEAGDATSEDLAQVEGATASPLEKDEFGNDKYERFKNGILTIGCLGFPNVGKSSLMNAIMGKKVVSVSRTPGHTKHFQTIFLTPTVKLCDCPGLVFPSKVPKPLQILSGSFPIAQVREPYSAIRYLAERLPLTRSLGLEHPEGEDNWTPYDICEAWAGKRGFYTKKGARKDAFRAGNNILRMTVEGRIRFYLCPLGYSSEKDKWQTSADVKELAEMLERKMKSEENEEYVVESSSSDEQVWQERDAQMANKFSTLRQDVN